MNDSDLRVVDGVEMRPVGKDGELVLYADAGDENGALLNTVANEWSRVQPLQVFFKWGNFEDVTP